MHSQYILYYEYLLTVQDKGVDIFCIPCHALTHWGLVTTHGDIELSQQWLKLLDGKKEHCLPNADLSE